MSTNPIVKQDNADSADPVVTETITAALEELNLDVVDNTETIEIKKAVSNNNGVPTQMFPQMMNMGFMPYNQMMPMHHQPGFYPPGDFPENPMTMGNRPPHPHGPMMFPNNGDIQGFPQPPHMQAPLGAGSGFSPNGIVNNSTTPPGAPMNGDVNIIPGTTPNVAPGPGLGLGFNDTLWPNSSRTQSNTANISETTDNDAAANVTIRRQTFHTISTAELGETSSTISKDNTNKDASGTLESSSTTMGAVSAVGAKTRTKSTSVQRSDRDTLFDTPATSSSLTSGTSKKTKEENDTKAKDMKNLQTYAAAYPYGGPLLQHMPHNDGAMLNGMPSPFPGGYEFAGPFQPFSPVLGGMNGPLPGQSPLPHMSPSPIQMGPPGTDPMGKNQRNGKDNGSLPLPPQHYPMMQHHPQNGSPPPWLYNGPPFNGMMSPLNGPHNPHGGMNMMNNNGNHHHKGPGRGSGRGGNFHGKGKYGKGNHYGYNNPNGNGYNDNRNGNNQYSQAKAEEAARFIDATLDEFVGDIYTLCKDQHGCRFLQKQLDLLGKEAADSIFEETKEHTVELMTDSFGNYLIQKLIEKITSEQKIELSNIAAPHFVEIALNPHGTRALQKLIECTNTDQEAQIVIDALEDSVIQLSKDLNGNHVIQKCLQTLKPEHFQFIFDAICNDCTTIATHRHGCCVLQRCLDFGNKEQCSMLCDKLLTFIDRLTLDPFGNYVVQYIISKETESNAFDYTYKIVHLIKTKMVELSVHKFGSNVIEKLLRTPVVAETLILELVNNKGESDIKLLLNDSYGNYVLQTALDVAHNQNDSIHDKLSTMVSPLLVGPIRNTPHGKRIIAMLHLEDEQ